MDLHLDAIAQEMSDCRITHMVYAPRAISLSGPTCPAI